MTCAEVRAALVGDEPLAPVVQAHLVDCPTCRGLAERWQAVRGELATWREEPAPPFLHARLVAAVRRGAGPALPPWRRLPRAAWAGAGLAALLVAVLATQGLLSRFESSPPPARGKGELARTAPVALQRAEVAEGPRGDGDLATAGEEAPAVAGGEEGPQAPPGGPLPTQRAAGVAPAPPPPGAAVVAPAPVRAADEAPTPVDKLQFQAAPPKPSWARPAAGQSEGPARAWLAEEMAAPAPPAGQVQVALLAAGGEGAFPLTVAAAAAPPSGQEWVVVVHQDGLVELEGPPAEALAELIPIWQRALASAHLPPGRYRAGRP